MLIPGNISRDEGQDNVNHTSENQVSSSFFGDLIKNIILLGARFRPSRLSVAIKLALFISIMITVAMSLLGAVIIHNQIQLLNRQINSTGRTVVMQMAESAKEPLLTNDTLLLDVLAHNLSTADDVIGTAIFSSDRKAISFSGNNPFENNAPYADQAREYLDGTSKILEWEWIKSPAGDIDAVSFISPVVFKNVIVGYTLISFSRSAMNHSIKDAVRSIISATTLLIILGIVTSYLLGRRLTRPIYHLVDAGRAISMGRYDYYIPEHREDEIGHLISTFNTTARALKLKSTHMAQGIRQKKQVANAFSRHVTPNVAKEILDNLEDVNLGGNHVNASVMFVDIVGFTSRSETMRPQEVAEMLNDFYTHVTMTSTFYKGTIDKFIGDSAMLLFGIPENYEGHVFHSIAYAVFFQKLMHRIKESRNEYGSRPLRFRIGINTGEMLAGYMGCSKRIQYTVVGDTVNLASRLCSAACADQIIITEETYNLPGIREKIVASKHQAITVRGKSSPVKTYLVHDVQQIYRYAMKRQIENYLSTKQPKNS